MFSGLYDPAKNYANLSGGKWVGASDGETISVRSPVDGSLVGTIPAMSQKDADAVIAQSKQAQTMWAHTPIYRRAELFYKAAEILEAHTDEIAEILVMEIAKDLSLIHI